LYPHTHTHTHTHIHTHTNTQSIHTVAKVVFHYSKLVTAVSDVPELATGHTWIQYKFLSY